MVAPRPLLVAVAALAVLALLAGTALAASKLTIPRAKQRAADFAAKTCKRDEKCVKSGVLNCRRKSRNVVFCRIFNRRHTEAQGRYVCNRLVRLSRNPKTNRVPVTGLGRWHC